MTHEDAGKYAEKHQGINLDEKIASRIKEKVTENTITCAKAHRTAEDLKVTPGEVGTAIDLLNVRIKKCQLGLFGYGKQIAGTPEDNNSNPEIQQAVEASLFSNRLTCRAAWDISKRFNIPKIKIGTLCESMNIKISTCQLGAFK